MAKLVNQRNSTIRHWTKEGLLEVVEITDAGYQLYAQEMVERIRLINELKSRRFTLREIREKILRDSQN
ncbi:MAG: MerR family transcriptional regulator [Candidatus Dadabacteria bacterium]|nr:MerR family transcriptional regulator [Candidatus Dadabacteria bacterium]